ncbi:sperm-associated antigen 7 homolog [Sycon ciliatum]|uniref:sperm-associated antigen 7 homolog n=1 Tax=Sycon ciliatum TaxID=27933 RepID=UPI0031F6A0E6
MDLKINKFCQSDETTKLELEPMNQVERSAVHEIADIAGLVSFAFGEEDVNRHLIIWKKEQAPCDAELAALRAGVPYDPAAVAAAAEAAKQSASATRLARPKPEIAPNSDYMNKYKKIIGNETEEKVALSVDGTKVFGCVPVSLKRDSRSIEVAMDEIRSRKKSRPADGAPTPSSTSASTAVAAASASDAPTQPNPVQPSADTGSP